MDDNVRYRVLKEIAGASGHSPADRAKTKIGKLLVHTRFCSQNAASPSKYKFNINPNTLSADYELWICGSSNLYYLIPISIMKQIYSDPEAYIDKRHPEIRVVSVDIEKHCVTYAKGGKKLNLSRFFRQRIT